MYFFSDLAGDQGYFNLTLAGTTLGDDSSVATAASYLVLTQSSNSGILPTGTYNLETLGTYWAISQTGAFSADNLFYTNNDAGSSVYETTSLQQYYGPIANPSYLTNGGLVFDGPVGSNIEINLFGTGDGNYQFYEGLSGGNYPIISPATISSVPEPSAPEILAFMALSLCLTGALRRSAV